MRTRSLMFPLYDMAHRNGRKREELIKGRRKENLVSKMCGICGELHLKPSASSQSLERMLGPLRKRGPDAVGAFAQQNISLGHRRLSILDLSPTSQQPMVDPALGLAIVFN